MDMTALTDKLIIFAALMGIGYICAKRGLLDEKANKIISGLTVNVFLTATIINSATSGSVEMTGREFLFAFAVMAVSLVLSYLIAGTAARLLPMQDSIRPNFEMVSAASNVMYFAMPVLNVLIGEKAAILCAVTCLPFNIILYSYGVYRLKGNRGNGLHLRDIITIHLIVTLFSTVLLILKPPIPNVIRSIVSTTAGATLPLSMILIGASLGERSLLAAFRNGPVYGAALLKLIVIPVVQYLVFSRFISDRDLLCAIVVIAASPAAAINTSLAIKHNSNPVFTSQGIMVSTLLSLLTIPAIVYFLL